jgi:hypothetical protein
MTIETYKTALRRHDWFHPHSDDYLVCRRGQDDLDFICRMQKAVDPDYEIWNSIAPEEYRRRTEGQTKGETE